jgi:4-amino-4-deoxy-L-arabinose transferase-like glycosyltransferase
MLKSASTSPSGKAPLAVVILAAAALYLLGNGRVSLWDRDEPRYAQCSRQMLFGFAGPGAHPPGFIVPHFLDDLRTEKPPLIYWLQAGAMKIFGDNSFAARLPSAMAMTAVLILLAWAFYRAVGPLVATWAVFVMATSALTIMSAKMCLTDATLLLFTTTAQLCTYAVYRGNRSWIVTLVLWGALGLGGLTKGPIVLSTIGATMVALAIFDYFVDRRWNFKWWLDLRPWVGLPILAVIVGPWLWLVNHQEKTFLPRLFGAAARHLTSAAEKHTAPPGFYLETILGLFFPWCLLMPTTLTIAFRNRRQPVVRYCLAVIFGVWIFQEIMKTKLPFYILPTFPALALLTGDALVRCVRKEHDDLLRPIFMTAVTVFAGAVLLLSALPWLIFGNLPRTLFHCNLYLGDLAPKSATIVLTVVSAIYAATVFGLFKTRRLVAAAIAMGVGMTAIFAVLFTLYLPNADFMRTSNRVAAILRPRHVAPGDGVMIEYKEPSLAFYQGGSFVEKAGSRFLETTPSKEWPAWIVMPKSLWEKTPASVRDHFEVAGEPVRGINYAGRIDGQQAIEVMVLKKKAN